VKNSKTIEKIYFNGNQFSKEQENGLAETATNIPGVKE